MSVRSLAIARQHDMFDSYDVSDFAGQFQEVFLTPYGRYWWSSVSFSYDDEVRDFGNRMLAAFDYSAITCANWREGYVEYLVKEEAQ